MPTLSLARLTQPALALAIAIALLPVAAQADAGASVAVQLAPISRGPAAELIVAYGIVAASAGSALTVSLPYMARVTRVLAQPGQRVSRGTALLVVEADPAAVIALTQAQSAAALARDELARTVALLNDGLATRSQLAAARKAELDARQALAEQARQGIVAGPRTIVSPADAVVSQIGVTPGDQVQAGAALAQLVGAGGGGREGEAAPPANVMLGVEPADARMLKPGDTLRIDGLSPRAGPPREGRVSVVGAAIDPQSQLVDVGAAVPLAGSALIPGTRVRAEIAANPGTWWNVPRPALLRDAQGAYVYQVGPDTRAHRIAVTTRVENQAGYGVDGPLHAGWPLVTSGNYELADGMAVRVDQGGAR